MPTGEPDRTPRSMDDLERRFREWALERADVEALIVVGSRARVDHPADEWADLDLGIITTQPAQYSRNAEWLDEIADVWVVHHDLVGTSWHVLFAGGFDAGVAPLSASMLPAARALLRALRFAPKARGRLPRALRRPIERAEHEIVAYCGRGARVLVDKRGRLGRLLRDLPDGVPREGLPSRADFDALVNRFWFEAVWSAKHLRRGELWYAKNAGVDGHMKTMLLHMLEWRARAVDECVDTWENGRFLEEWAEPATVRELAGAFARYDSVDAWTALIATMSLFGRLARETAERLGYPYAAGVEQRVTTWVTQRYTQTLP